MTKYRVKKAFTDLKDVEPNGKKYVYNANDLYPRKGRAKKERLAELLGNDNLRGESLIEVYEDSTEQKSDEPKTELANEVQTVKDTDVKVVDK